MTAKNPRLSVTLKPSLAAQLRRLSELTGNSQSAIIGDLLDGSGPVFDRLIQVLEAAKTAKESMKGKLANDMGQAQNKMENALRIVMQGFDEFTGSVLDEAKAVTRRARRPASRAQRDTTAGALVEAKPTPISNRGVRLDPIATKTIAQNRLMVRPKAGKVGVKIRGGEK